MSNHLFLWVLFFSLSATAFGQDFRGGWITDPDFEARTPDIAKTRRIPLALPSAFSRKADCPPVRNQGDYSTCMGYALSCARTLLEVTQTGRKQAFSPIFIYKLSKWASLNCKKPIPFDVLEDIREKGAAPFDVLPEPCVETIPDNAYSEAKPYPIKDYNPLITPKMSLETCQSRLENIKDALVAGNSVAIGMFLPPSFTKAKRVWQWQCPPEYEKKNYWENGHAMCIVGYDDKKFGKEGGFEIINSFGTDWGDNGFIWMRYSDFVRVIGAAYELFPHKIFTPKGNLPDFVGKIQFKRAEKQDKSILKVVSNTQTRGLRPVALQNSCFELADPLYSGNRFQIVVQNEIPAYIYVFSTDRTQKVEQLFPLGVRALIPAGQEILLPDENTGIELDDTVGDDYMVVLYSKYALNPHPLKLDLEAAAGDFPTRIANVLGSLLVDNHGIQFGLGDVPLSEGAVSVIDKKHSVLAMIFHFNHL
jgi:Domain of unknown function (DUF4384)/Papain family cysteine protease